MPASAIDDGDRDGVMGLFKTDQVYDSRKHKSLPEPSYDPSYPRQTWCNTTAFLFLWPVKLDRPATECNATQTDFC